MALLIRNFGLLAMACVMLYGVAIIDERFERLETLTAKATKTATQLDKVAAALPRSLLERY